MINLDISCLCVSRVHFRPLPTHCISQLTTAGFQGLQNAVKEKSMLCVE